MSDHLLFRRSWQVLLLLLFVLPGTTLNACAAPAALRSSRRAPAPWEATHRAISSKSRLTSHRLNVPARDAMVIHYLLIPRVQQEPRQLLVRMRFALSEDTDSISLQMPVWSPGDYHVQNHGQYVTDLTAWEGNPDDRHPLTVMHPELSTWTVSTGGVKQITVSYSLPQTPPGFFSENVQLLNDQVFVNGPAAYLYLVGHKDARAELHVDLPPNWQMQTALEPVGNASDTFTAPDYDVLADSPLVMAAAGRMKLESFTFKGATYQAVYFGHLENLRDPAIYTPVLSAIADAESAIMEIMPIHGYRILFDVDGRGGGLEHRNCCRIALPSGVAPRLVAAFVSHEFFHQWNVKEIRPRVLGPFDYIHPPQTRNLWFAEGVTEYYANVATRRAGIAPVDQFVRHFALANRRMARNPERLRVTADESSLRVWEAGNSEGYGFSYYEKGELIGLCLDLKILQVTQSRRSLDNVMRLLLLRHDPPKPGYGEDEIRETVNEVAEQDLSAFYDQLARSTQELPVAECLSYAGYDGNGNPLPAATPEQLAVRARWIAGRTEGKP